MGSPDLLKVPIDDGTTKKTDWQSLAVGIFIGYLLTLGWVWYNNRNDKPDDWCNGMPTSEQAFYCHDLYQKYVDYVKWQNENYGDRPGSNETPF